jgi:anti-sigma regulatory factor (Ser/Thr protein kinase)
MSGSDTGARQPPHAQPERPPDARVVVACVLACVPAAPVAARSMVTQALTGRVDRCVLADAGLMVSELVTNSVKHAALSADDFVRVDAAVSAGVLHLEVDNPGVAGTIAARDPDSELDGFGLGIVDTLADAWGVSRDGHTRVWVELACWPATDAPAE